MTYGTDEEIQNHRYRVWIRSRPGMYEQYDGKVDVWASDEDEAQRRALRELRTGTFKDRSDAMWKVERVERIPAP